MIEARVYRAAFIPALLALVLAMFSFQSRPAPLPQGLAADILFDGDEAAQLAERIATEQPDRRAGQPGDAATAELVASELARGGFQPDQIERQRFTPAGRRLENVIARRAGGSRRQIVVVAARDASAVPDAPAAPPTRRHCSSWRGSSREAVAQDARARVGRRLGARRGRHRPARLGLGSQDFVDAVLVMSSVGSDASEPSVQAWSNDSRRAGIGLQRTVAESIRQGSTRRAAPPGCSASSPGSPSRSASGRRVLLAEGYEAVRISGSGELPPPGDGPVGDIDEDRLGALGRATLRTVTALDQGRRPAHGPESYVLAVSQVLPAG